MSTESSSTSKVLLALFGGIAAGVVIGYWLNSDRGRKLRNDAIGKMSDLEERIETRVKEVFQSAKKKADEVVKN
jgi:hypothetical protein